MPNRVEILHFAQSGGNMQTGIAWGVVFILVNVYQIHRLIRECMDLRRMGDVVLLRQGMFAGLDNARLSRLVTAASWRSVEPGTRLTPQGKPVAERVLPCAGLARVDVNDKTVAKLHAGTLCRERGIAGIGQPPKLTPRSSHWTWRTVSTPGAARKRWKAAPWCPGPESNGHAHR